MPTEHDPYVEHEYRKVATIRAIKLKAPIVVNTLEGPMHGKAGDYLATGVDGEQWPIDASIFERTYVLAE